MSKHFRCSKPTISGQAFTNYACPLCETIQMWHNTATPAICPECAEKHPELCEVCGKHIEIEKFPLTI